MVGPDGRSYRMMSLMRADFQVSWLEVKVRELLERRGIHAFEVVSILNDPNVRFFSAPEGYIGQERVVGKLNASGELFTLAASIVYPSEDVDGIGVLKCFTAWTATNLERINYERTSGGRF